MKVLKLLRANVVSLAIPAEKIEEDMKRKKLKPIMSRKCLVVLISLISFLGLGAQDASDAVSDSGGSNQSKKFKIGPTFSSHWGRADNLVYDNSNVPDENNNPYYSLLFWDLQSLYSVGIEGKWEYGSTAYMDFSVRSAIPGQYTGQMNDFDWFFSDREWSHWSLHDTTLRWGFTADLFNSWKVLSASPFSIGLGLGYHLDWWAWTDKQIDNIYSTVDTNNEKYPQPYAGASSVNSFRDYKNEDSIGKDSIDNAISAHVLAASIDLSLEWEYAYLRLLGRIGPVFAHGQDHHKLRIDDGGPDGIIFHDYVFGGPWMEGQFEVGITMGWFVLALRGEYAFMPPTQGTQHSVYSNDKPDKYANGGGGLAFNRFTMSTTISWRM